VGWELAQLGAGETGSMKMRSSYTIPHRSQPVARGGGGAVLGDGTIGMILGMVKMTQSMG
jgi:hypothetical protein